MSQHKQQSPRQEEMFTLLDQQLKSGLSQLQFCQNHQISIATFSYWRKKYLMKKQPTPTNQYSPYRNPTTQPNHLALQKLANQSTLHPHLPTPKNRIQP
jgi:hypothetical protein